MKPRIQCTWDAVKPRVPALVERVRAAGLSVELSVTGARDLYGGELDAGPRPGGGWRVRVKIPLEGLRASARLGGPGEGGEPAGPVRPEFLASPR